MIEFQDNQAATEALIDELSRYKHGYDEMQDGNKMIYSILINE